MGQPTVKVGVVDIGTNSMRMLITDGTEEDGRWVEVTGLGRGVDATGRLSAEAMERSLAALSRFGGLLDRQGVDLRGAMATSATRDAENREEFLDRAGEALGIRPDVIGGDREGRLAFSGAVAGLDEASWVVSDIGGGSTEFVIADRVVSVDIGSVRLTDRVLADRPATIEQMELAREHVRELFSEVEVRGDLVGVAGTWTTLAALDMDLGEYDRVRVHHHRLTESGLASITAQLAGMTVDETAALPSLDPARAPVILAGAVVAGCVLETAGVGTVLVSEHDSLDGLALELLAVT
jgi:exopolyphosphatase/guanosine-5'-triphosphate,3'-diphosphate pyrophosphatase